MTGHVSPPPGRITYANGRYVRHRDATVHVEDRGLQFADSVYESIAVVGGRLVNEGRHLDRLDRNLTVLAIPQPMTRPALRAVLREILRRNRMDDGLLYVQVTRGTHRRDHPIPVSTRPTLLVTARRIDPDALEERRKKGVTVVTVKDIRWGRRDLKTTGLLANVLAKTDARARGAYEAWLVDDEGFVTEGSSTNAWIVTASGTVVTRQLSEDILPGVTRAHLLHLLKDRGIPFEERPFSVAEAMHAKEAFLTAATAGIVPVVRVNNAQIGDGRPGERTTTLQHYRRESVSKSGS